MRTLALLLLSVPLAARSTWTVAAGGGGDFTSLVAAVGSPAVTDGDRLLVEPGTWRGETSRAHSVPV